jgi:hypothetical protein
MNILGEMFFPLTHTHTHTTLHYTELHLEVSSSRTINVAFVPRFLLREHIHHQNSKLHGPTLQNYTPKVPYGAGIAQYIDTATGWMIRSSVVGRRKRHFSYLKLPD